MLGEWINTGDKYYVDEDNFYWCAGRQDDMLKVGGIWVSPLDVENCLREHPAVLENAIIGFADEKGLIKPKAFVVLRQGYDASKEMEEELKNGPWKRWQNINTHDGLNLSKPCPRALLENPKI